MEYTHQHNLRQLSRLELEQKARQAFEELYEQSKELRSLDTRVRALESAVDNKDVELESFQEASDDHQLEMNELRAELASLQVGDGVPEEKSPTGKPQNRHHLTSDPGRSVVTATMRVPCRQCTCMMGEFYAKAKHVTAERCCEICSRYFQKLERVHRCDSCDLYYCEFCMRSKFAVAVVMACPWKAGETHSLWSVPEGERLPCTECQEGIPRDYIMCRTCGDLCLNCAP